MAERQHRIAGWEDGRTGKWYNVEKGDRRQDSGLSRGPNTRAPSDRELADSPRIVAAASTPNGEWEYVTLSYVTDDYPLDEQIDDAFDEGDYGGDAAGG